MQSRDEDEDKDEDAQEYWRGVRSRVVSRTGGSLGVATSYRRADHDVK